MLTQDFLYELHPKVGMSTDFINTVISIISHNQIICSYMHRDDHLELALWEVPHKKPPKLLERVVNCSHCMHKQSGPQTSRN